MLDVERREDDGETDRPRIGGVARRRRGGVVGRSLSESLSDGRDVTESVGEGFGEPDDIDAVAESEDHDPCRCSLFMPPMLSL